MNAPLLVRVTGIPAGVSEQMFEMIFENKRYGGGQMRRMEFNQTEHSAVIEFEERAGVCVGVVVVIVLVAICVWRL